MLKADDYKQYITGIRGSLRITKHYLSKWDYYERNVSKLVDIELKKAKILYEALGHLTEDERKFLANKYRVTLEEDRGYTLNYKRDKDLAKEAKMTMKEYIQLRRGIELKFFHYLKQIEGAI